MELNRNLLKDAIENGLISEQQADPLWKFLSERGKDTPSFRFTHVLYYLGGLIAMGAMSLFMTLGWERFGGWGLFFIALAYAGAGLWLTEFFLNRSRLPIPAGLTATFVVVLTPLAVYGLQVALGWWAEGKVFREYHTLVDWWWMLMELATLASGAVLLWRYRLPFLVMPVAVTLWYMSMDLTPFLFGDADWMWELRKFVSLWFGLLIVLLAFWVDLRTRHDKDYRFPYIICKTYAIIYLNKILKIRSVRSCLKTNLLIVIANLPTMIGQNRPQAGSYVNKALILLGQFFDSL
ncbi:MAG: hypothetical protein MZV65_33335 [Chromatiales bacterium]|nr:hypothetical protein [Chromatiales bacterium]